MNLLQNPFYIIGVSTRDSKQTIVENCDTKSLTLDADLCTSYLSILTQPRNRLSAELAWVPGLSPSRSLGLIKRLLTEPDTLLTSLDGINPVARCNALVTFLEHYNPNNESQITSLLIEIAQSFDRIDLPDLMTLINEDRQIAKIPVIQDVENINQEMQTRREYMIGTMKNCLNNIKDPDKVLTEIVVKTTSGGKEYPPILVEELTDKYQIEVQKYLDELVGQIRNIISIIEEQPKQTIEHQMPNLYKYLTTWDQIAKPIQLICQSKGLDDAHSKELAYNLRGLAITIANKYEMHSEAKQLIKVMTEIFKELPQFAELMAEDITTLDGLIEQKIKSAEEESKSDKFNKVIEPITQKIKSGKSEKALEEINLLLYNDKTDVELKKILQEIKQTVEARIIKHGKPIGSAPTMRTINGIGTTVYGDTLYFVVLFIPLIPIARYSLEKQSDGRYSFFGKMELHKWQKYWQYILIGIVAIWILSAIFGK